VYDPRRKRRPLVPVLALLLPILLLVGIWLGGHPSVLPGFLRDSLAPDRDSEVIEETLDAIETDYIRKVDRDRLVNKSVDGAVKSLGDRFSHYFDPRSYRHFKETTEGAFSGVGINVTGHRRGLHVVEVIPNSPAQRAGLRRGDLVVAVGKRTIAGRSSQFASGLIRGKPGTSVTLTVLHRGRRRAVPLTRARVTVPSVDVAYRRVDGRKVAVVELTSFTERVAELAKHVVDRALAAGAKGVILDLRGNGGGLLGEAVGVSSIFIPEGPIVSTSGRSRGRRTYQASGRAIPSRIPLVVVVDGGTASAAEIVAGAMKDRKRGAVVGVKTFGKGVFQEVRPLPNGGALDLTVGQYFTPSGRSPGGAGNKRGAGITPDVRARDAVGTRRDEALDAALRTLAGRLLR